MTYIPAYLFATNADKSSGEYCHITSVKIPSSVSAIGTYAFHNCYDLAKINFAGTSTRWSYLLSNSDTGLDSSDVTLKYGNESSETLGDLDGDNSITIQDAYNALMAYSKTSAGLSSGLTDAQKTSADVDGDGKITINDAYKILLYYATKSAGGTPTWD